MTDGRRKAMLLRPSGILSANDRALGEGALSCLLGSGESVSALNLYGQTILTGNVSSTSPATLSGVGEIGAGNTTHIPVRLHGESMIGGTEFCSLLAQALPADVSEEEPGVCSYTLLQTTDTEVLGAPAFRFKPRTAYTIFLTFTSDMTDEDEPVSGFLFSYRDGSETLIEPSGYELTENRIVCTSDPQKDLIGIRFRAKIGEIHSVTKSDFMLSEGTKTDGLWEAYNGTDVDLVIPNAPLFGMSIDGIFVADSYNAATGVVTRRFRSALADGYTRISNGVFRMNLSVLADPITKASFSTSLQRVGSLDEVTVGSYTYFVSPAGESIYLSVKGSGRPTTEINKFIADQANQLFYAVKTPFTENATVCTITPRIGRLGVIVRTGNPPRRVELIRTPSST